MKFYMKTELALGVVAMLMALRAFAAPNPDRDASPQSWSFDAFICGNTVTTPPDAYKYAKGEPITQSDGLPDQD